MDQKGLRLDITKHSVKWIETKAHFAMKISSQENYKMQKEGKKGQTVWVVNVDIFLKKS